ncbi:MAG: hypothetical protein IPM54_18900 [Polyangiaceae bacterium]|nr:hypothetical protein [Polyangiaceae bacterium]
MFQIKIDKVSAIIEFHLEGIFQMDEMTQFVDQLKAATLSLKGNQIKIKADLRRFKPSSPAVADMIRQVQEFGLSNGVIRVAEMVESEVLALQLNRVARESGTHKILHRFADEQEAREWLVLGEVARKSQRF